MKIVLKFPFTTAAGQRVESLDVKRATRGDLKAARRHSGDEVAQEDFLFSRLTGLVPEDLDLLDVADAMALQDAFRAMQFPGDDATPAGRNTAAGAAPGAV